MVKAAATLEPETTKHKSLDRLQTRKELSTTIYVSGYTQTDPNGMLSPNNGRLSGANKVGLFRADSMARYLLQCA